MRIEKDQADVIHDEQQETALLGRISQTLHYKISWDASGQTDTHKRCPS